METADPAKTYTLMPEFLQDVPANEIRWATQVEFRGDEDLQPSNRVITRIMHAAYSKRMYDQMRRIQLAIYMLTSYGALDCLSTVEIEVLKKMEFNTGPLPPKGLLLNLHANGAQGAGWADLEGVFPVIVNWEGYSFEPFAPELWWPKGYFLKLRTGSNKYQEHTFLFQLSGDRPRLNTHQDLQECLARAMIIDLLRSHAMRQQFNSLVPGE